MLTFLTPAALIGLATVAIPLVIHLFKPKRTRLVPFSSLRWLRESQQRLSKRIQLHQLFLFLLRAAILALLVLAIAKPVFGRRGDAGAKHRIVVIDAGRAMGCESGRGVTAMARARSTAIELLGEVRAGDLTSVCVVGDSVRALGPLTPDPSLFLDDVARLSDEGSERCVSEALRLIPLLQRGKKAPEELELFFLTANLDESWRQSDINDFIARVKSPVRVTVIAMMPVDPQNAWIAKADRLRGAGGNTQLLRVQVQANDAGIVKRTVRLSGVRGLATLEQEITLEAGRPSWTTFELPLSEQEEVSTALLTLHPGDVLADDDRYWVDLAPRGEQVALVIEPDVTQVAELQPGFHLRTALATLAEATPGRLRIIMRRPEAVRESDLMEAGWIFWVDPRPLSDSNLKLLREQVVAGVGIALFLGPYSDSDYCNTALWQNDEAQVGVLPCRVGGVVSVEHGGALVRLTRIAWSHPWLAPFADPVYGDLARANFKAYQQLDSLALEGGTALACYPDKTPALIEHDLGAGRVVVINSSANDLWSNLPRLRGYLPWVDGLLEHLGGRREGDQLEVGEAACRILSDLHTGRPVELLDPEGSALGVTVERHAGRYMVQSAPLRRPGIHTVSYTSSSGGERHLPLLVQTGRKFSRLMPVESEMLESWWAPVPLSMVVAESGVRLRGVAILRNSLELLLLLAALLLFFVETLLAAWLTPRVNPRITSRSVIAKRGFFRDGSGGEERQ